MTLLTYFSRAWSAEHIRLRHTWIWKLVLIAPLFVCTLYFCIFYFKGEHFVQADQLAWNVYISNTTRTVFLLFLPLFVILFTLLHQQLDHQAQIRKLVYTLPNPQGIQVLAQWLYGFMLYTLTCVAYLLLLLASGWLLSLLKPSLPFEQFADSRLFLAIFNGYLASLGILALQLVLNYYVKNMVLPLSIGLGGFISAMVLLNWEHVVYHPFAYPIFAFMTTSQETSPEILIQPVVLGLAFATFLLIAGYVGRKKAAL